MLGDQEVQPRQPVAPGDGDDAAVREVDEAGAVGEGTLLAEQVAVVRGDAFVAALGGDGAGQGQQGLFMRPAYDSAPQAGFADCSAAFAAQSAQRPKIAKCFMSVSNPNVPRSFSVNSATTPTSASMTSPQSRQTRWMW